MNKKEILEKNNFRCYKCNYTSFDEKEFYIINISNKTILLCSICNFFKPKEIEKLERYIEEKIDGTILETFRKTGSLVREKIKKSMEEKVKQGKIITRPPFGYSIKENKLVPNENAVKIQEIFNKFLKEEISLNNLAKQYGFSVNGIKKILKNPIYIGKIKFKEKLIDSYHQPLITKEQFVKVQRKLENIKKN